MELCAFTPGLVGGHCIGVDPYYLTHKAEKMGYHPKLILAGRSINDDMSAILAKRITSAVKKKFGNCEGAKIGILGLTFKENCSDFRNSKIFDTIHLLVKKGFKFVFQTQIYRKIISFLLSGNFFIK